MYDELIKRLRELQTITKHCGEQSCDECENRELCDKHDNKTLSGTYQEAADAIEELLQKMQQLPRWIPVTERLPERIRKSYLCLTDTGYHCEVRWTNNVYGLLTSSMDNEWGWSIADVPQFCKVTHWMPLPEPPKEET